MKRLLCVFFCFCLLAGVMSGCRDVSPGEEGSVRFYYPRREIAYGGQDGVIGEELREVQEYSDDLEYLLRLYLQGPTDPELRLPFPRYIRLISVAREGDTLEIVLGPSLDSLSVLERTLACAGLTMTCLELCDAANVRIHAQEGVFSGDNAIVMDREALLTLDDCYTSPTTVPES